MRIRGLGKSGIEVGEIGLGTWGLSGEGYGPIDPDVARATLRAALDAGVNYIDTAGCYGRGAMETLIGEVIRDRPREDIFLATRVGVDRDAPLGPKKRFDHADVFELTEGSLARLGVKALDAVILHNPLVPTLDAGMALKALFNLKAKGLTRLVGVSVSSPKTAAIALEFDIDILMLPYNLLFPRLLHRIAADVANAGVGLVVRSPLAYGLLADTWAADRKFGEQDHRSERWNAPELARRVRQREAARSLVHDDVTTLRDAALRYVLANGLVSVAVVGARTPEQARENAGAAATLPYLANDDLGQIGNRLKAAGVEF